MRNFRNFNEHKFELDPSGLTLITGPNGIGKTSILEAISYLSVQRSFRGAAREVLIRTDDTKAFLRGEIVDQRRRSLVEIEIDPSRRDLVLLNHQRVRRSIEIRQIFQVTVFTPDDLTIIKGGPQHRRDYLDDLLEAISPKMQAVRQATERAIRQRNTLLRQANGRITPEIQATLDVWDDQLAMAGNQLISARCQLLEQLTPIIEKAFQQLTGTSSAVAIDYVSSSNTELQEALQQARKEDISRGLTTVGPHRDDFAVSVDRLDARTRLSQGRQRGITLSLRLGAHQIVERQTECRPILLLDDVFSELDSAASQALFHALPPGQALLTTAGPIPESINVARSIDLGLS